MNALDILLKLYETYPVASIETDGALLLKAFGVKGRSELLAVEGYPEAFALVSASAATVEGLSSRHPDKMAQVRESLRLLRRMIDDGESATKFGTTKRLIETILRGSWFAEQQAAYDAKKEMLEWRDFFVSYTNRDASAINVQFMGLIKSSGLALKKGAPPSNYVARVINRHLRRYQGLSGFFDEDDLKVGEEINTEVDQYCTRAFAFVQLIESLSFEREPPQNWCFYEYRQFSTSPAVVRLLGDANRHFFILAGGQFDALQPANPASQFATWFARIATVSKTHIALDGERNTTLKTKIKDIATQIVAIRAQIVDAWLNE